MKLTLLGILLAWNILVFAIYGWDKKKARKGQYRISERTLLSIALTGAGFGALIAGKLFHHKTRKWYFWLVWWLGALLESYCLYWIIKGEI